MNRNRVNPYSPPTHGFRSAQRGVMLLESLLAILLFSIGILAVVGLQAQSIAQVGQAKYRADAAFLANQVLAQMWADRGNVPSYAWSSGTAPAQLTTWAARVSAGLPAGGTYKPKITVASTVYAGPPAYTDYQVSVTVFWQTPEEANAKTKPPPHNFTTSASIQCC
jgi:type IV pilus assembly protein PilV